MRIRMHDAEFDLSASTESCLGKCVNDLASEWCLLAVLGILLTAGEQLKLLPVAEVAQAFGLIDKIPLFVEDAQRFLADASPIVLQHAELLFVAAFGGCPEWP